jgi:hypothetical protein
MYIDILPFAVEAFTYNKTLWDDIDKLYQTNKYEFYKTARESKYYNHKLLKEGDIYKEEYGKKVLGILLYLDKTRSEELNDAIVNLIQKGWPHVIKYVEKNQKIVIEDYIKKYLRLDMSVNRFNTELTILYWWARMAGKEIEMTEGLRRLEETLYMRMKNYEEGIYNYSFDNLPQADKNKVLALKKRLEEKYGILVTFTDIYDFMKLRSETEMYAFIADTEELSFEDLFDNIRYTKKDALELLGIYFMINRNLNAENAIKYFIPATIIKSLLKAYKAVKEHYFANNKETMYLEMQRQDEKIKALEEENKFLRNKLEKLEKGYKTVEKDIEDRYISKIKELEVEVKKLQGEVLLLKQNEEELFALREFLFSLDKQETMTIDVKDIDLSNIKGIIIGGYDQWHNRMKKYLPTFTFINNESFDTKIFDNTDIIIFFPNFLNHKLYYKAINEARKRNLPVGYISSLNEELALQQIKEIIKKRS